MNTNLPRAERTADIGVDAVATRRVPLTRSGAPTILIVDDSRYIRELLTLHLSNAGYDVAVAEDAVAAMKFLLHERPALMLVDVDMPFMDGFELFEAVKRDPAYASVAVIFLTGRDDAETRAMTLGARACLHKPLFTQDLLAAVAGVANTGRFPIG